jgi:hypothetical protein
MEESKISILAPIPLLPASSSDEANYERKKKIINRVIVISEPLYNFG